MNLVLLDKLAELNGQLPTARTQHRLDFTALAPSLDNID